MRVSRKVFLVLAVLVLELSFFAGDQAQAQPPQATPPPPAAPRSLQIPRAVEQTFTNGLRVIVIERAGTPLVSAQLIIKNGAEVDPPSLAGLAHLTASLLTLGTRTRTATQIAEAIEALGGSQSSEAGWDASAASVGVMSSKISPALEILADAVRHPTFKADEIERLRQQYIDYLNVQLSEPGAIASFVAARVLYGAAPYGHPLGGTPESLTRIKRADIVGLHRNLYRPDNAILMIGGDIRADLAFSFARKYFGDWKRPALRLRPSGQQHAGRSLNGKARVLVIDKPDAEQAAIVVTRAGISRRDPDYFSGIVTNSVLDGYSGRLNQEIRIKRGLSYSVGSGLDSRREVGPFVASAQTRNDAGAQVAELLLGELNRLATAPISETELVPRKAVLVGNFSRELEQLNGLVNDVGFLAMLGLSLDETNQFVNNVQAVSASDVQRFAATHLKAGEASIVVVGNAKEFLPQLKKQFKGVEVIPIAELDLNSAGLRKSRTRASKIGR
ncbi:MAG: peptidase protein [Acidobacteria bacterium]|nr:peptidase protein [Acidobacteriota bacterium]